MSHPLRTGLLTRWRCWRLRRAGRYECFYFPPSQKETTER